MHLWFVLWLKLTLKLNNVHEGDEIVNHILMIQWTFEYAFLIFVRLMSNWRFHILFEERIILLIQHHKIGCGIDTSRGLLDCIAC